MEINERRKQITKEVKKIIQDQFNSWHSRDCAECPFTDECKYTVMNTQNSSSLCELVSRNSDSNNAPTRKANEENLISW
jgi:hypothetical protein